MRLNIHSFCITIILFLGELDFCYARPSLGDLKVRQDTNSSSTTIPSQTSAPSSATSISSTSSGSVLSGTTALSSLTSVTLPPSQTHSTSSASSASPTTTENPNDPAVFFSNRNARIILISTVAGIVGIVVILTLWINFRRSWYFPWNKKKQRNNPARWSVYSFREKPRLPLGRTLQPDQSVEQFNRRSTAFEGEPSAHGHGTSEGHGYGTSDGHGYGSADSHAQLLRIHPIPEIVIDSPKSAVTPKSATRSRPWSFARQLPPGLDHHNSRWSTATTHISAGSIYSERVVSFAEDTKTADKYASGERLSAFRPETATSTSSDNSPFRFDPPRMTEANGRTITSNPTNLNNASHPLASSSASVTRDWRGGYIEPVTEVSESEYDTNTRGSSILRELSDEESHSDGPKYGLSALKVDWDVTPRARPTVLPDLSTVDLGPSTSAPTPRPTLPSSSPIRGSPLASSAPATSPLISSPLANSPLGDVSMSTSAPKGILKSPHYLTTSARMARSGKNMI